MKIKNFFEFLNELGADLFTGVPDSLLASFTDEIVRRYGISEKHIVAANEGAAVGIAAGHYLATGNPAVVYMQNSGIGNAINPICSLIHKKAHAIPVIFVIGWRGEPGTKDEPQHVFQGEITLKTLDSLDVPYFIVSRDANLKETAEYFKRRILEGVSVALVVKNGAFAKESPTPFANNKAPLSREDALKIILKNSQKSDIFICATGKLSREVHDLRIAMNDSSNRDFLTVGSMGHCIMIAFGVALAKPNSRVFCLDGDGSMLMHMGSVAVVGTNSPKNLIHIVINNGAHETVGGMPTASAKLRLADIAKACGYADCRNAKTSTELETALKSISDGPVFIETICNLNSRSDLGRPLKSPEENKKLFMKKIK